MYLLALAVTYIVSYFTLLFGIPFFFDENPPKIQKRSLLSIASILALYFLALFLSFSISDPEFANRILHAVGGGVITVIVCFFAARDSKIKINPFQFLVIGISIATFFGVGNEIAEYILQNHFGLVVAESINDTWLDLISNTVGSTLTALCLAPFFRKMK